MNINFDESKIVKIVLDADKDSFICLDLENGEVTGMKIISKKEPRVFLEGASVLDREAERKLDRELIDKSYGIAQKIRQLRGDSGTASSVGKEIKEAIKKAQDEDKTKLDEAKYKAEKMVRKADESKKIIDALESDDFKKHPITFKPDGKTSAIMEELKEEAEKDFKMAWNEKNEPTDETTKDILEKNKEIVTYGGKRDKEIEFQDGVTEKEQQILDIVSETPIDKLAESEAFLKKIGEYKNLMKSKMTKFEASKKVKDKLNYGEFKPLSELK